ncbi:carrier protein [Capsaspora owczarzaki ATCC 30864]|uniref:Carrier protein n=1 Tax=Capsaspora owczarzaki (strain ATCC 30864) TaxID=595528 RepID=A0A0D2U1W2_CAPO3|nr:carrier protein [Capsaspora owczarzaki ATCC 30864]KJE89181.1 carrier protein [Capsaspora owczarzaki ATCC 30864]|eukprot:XP_004365572.1 carrier protein [Capsaspora owczarzaki ATCC 30864]
MAHQTASASASPLPPPPQVARSLPMEINWKDLDFARYTVIGSTLLLGVRTLVYPLALAKTRLQVQRSHPAPTAPGATPPVVYRNVFHVWSGIARAEGLRGLYRGFMTTVVGITPAQAIYLTSYEYVKSHAQRFERPEWSQDKKTLHQNLIAGFLSSVCSQVIIVPIDVIVQRQMVQGTQSAAGTAVEAARGGYAEFRHILATQGVRGLYRGLHLSLMLYPPSSAIWWATYGATKQGLHDLKDAWFGSDSADANDIGRHAQGFAIQTVAGLFAGFTSGCITTPLDVIKTRYQLASRGNGAAPTVAGTIRTLLQEDGMAGFTKGMTARVMHMAIPSVLMISVYELTKRLSVVDAAVQ